MNRVRKQLRVPNRNFNKKEDDFSSVAVLDSGISEHPDLEGQIVAFEDFVNHKNKYYDDNGHGTHVCGIIAGTGFLSEGCYKGMIPGMNLLVGKVLDKNGDGSAENMIEGIRWVIHNKNKYAVRVLNISVGIGKIENRENAVRLQKEIAKAWEEGILVVCAAGNNGPLEGTLSELGNSKNAICVGCHDGEYCKGNPKRCDLYSGRGKRQSLMRKPDIVAPGTGIVSCNTIFHKKPYIAKSGTSMATPIVTGALSMAILSNPGLTNEKIVEFLRKTAMDLGEPWHKQGWGMINVNGLLEECIKTY